jgi:hypothetical protein
LRTRAYAISRILDLSQYRALFPIRLLPSCTFHGTFGHMRDAVFLFDHDFIFTDF